MRRTERRARRTTKLFFVLVVLPFFTVFPYLRDINNPNELTRVFTTMMLVEKGTFRIDEPVALWGWVNDMAHAPGLDRGHLHYTMVKAPGAAYLGVPGYWVFSKVVAPALGRHFPTAASSQEQKLWWLRNATWSMRLFASQLPCFLFLLWFERYLRAFTHDAAIRLSAVAACGLGTNYLAYTHMFASHAQYAAVAFLAFASIEREKRLSQGDPRARRWTMALAAGWCTSACVALEYHALFIAILLSIFAATTFWRPTRLVAFGAGALANVPPVMIFHWRAYGNPLTPGHQMLETPGFAETHHTGLWGIVWPTWDHVEALAVDPGFGFFGMSPYMWIALIGIPVLLFSGRNARRATIMWALCGLTLFLVNAGIIVWRAGWTVGPRYLSAAPPFFAFGAALALERFARSVPWRRAVARGVGGGLALASVLAIGTVSLVYDTLPEAIQRPFLQFAVPMAYVGFVPHHVGEWFGWSSTTLWYIACAAMLAAPILAGIFALRERGWRRNTLRVVVFVLGLAAGLVPQFSKPSDGSPLFVVHPSAAFGPFWEPAGRDRIAELRVDAERYGSRGPGPCLWLKIVELERIASMTTQAARDRPRTNGVTRAQCRMRRFYPAPFAD